MLQRNKILGLLTALVFCVISAVDVQAEEPRKLRFLTHDSFSASKSLVEDFQKINSVQVQFISGGDAGETLTKAILTKGNPIADVLFGVDNTFAGRALSADIFVPYESPMLRDVPAELRIDPSNRLLPVDSGTVCLVYDKAYFASGKIPVPRRLEDLTRSEYRGLTVVENPATSSPGLAFLLATVARFGETGSYPWLKYWEDLRKNGVLVVGGWNEAYYGEFSAAGKGRKPIVVSYATGPAADVFFASEPKPKEPRVGTLAVEEGSFRQIEFVGILKGTKAEDLARTWVDFLLSVKFQEDIPLQMFVYPANSRARLPELFLRFAPVPVRSGVVDPARIDEKRDEWIAAWTRVVLK
jgi:thiamine transport system substrate-binding protein